MADWRKVPFKTQWRTVKETDRFTLLRQQELWVDFDSGEEKWKDEKEGFSGNFIERIVQKVEWEKVSNSLYEERIGW